jgi:hypothetical protein
VTTAWSGALFALSDNVIPELREARERYYLFWDCIGALAIVGWVAVLFLYRRRSVRPSGSVGLAAVAIVFGGGLGGALWIALSAYSWGDIGVGERWLGELAACVLGGVAWVLVAEWVFFCRQASDKAHKSASEAVE